MGQVESIIVVSMIKNEEELIESAIRYWLSFADHVMIYDHYSTDGTKSIINAIQKEYPSRLLFYKPDFDVGIEYVQREITDQMIREAFLQYNADLVFPLDADEFPYLTQKTNNTIREYLCNLDQDHCYYTYWVPFACSDAFQVNTSRFAPLSYREKRKEPIAMFRKYLIAGKQYREDPISVTKGNHELYRASGKTLPQEVDISSELCYAHYMFRGLSHLKIKAAAGWIANYSDIRWNGDSGHYQRIVRMILEGKIDRETVRWANLTCCGLTEERLQHVQVETICPYELFEPIPILKYTDQYMQGKDEFTKLLETSLALVDEYRETKKALSCKDGTEDYDAEKVD